MPRVPAHARRMDTPMTAPTACYGRAAIGRCAAPPRYAVTYLPRSSDGGVYSCGRHIAWIIARMTIPGSAVTVHALSTLPRQRHEEPGDEKAR